MARRRTHARPQSPFLVRGPARVDAVRGDAGALSGDVLGPAAEEGTESGGEAGAGSVNASEVVQALRVHYGDGYRLVEQVADHTGYRASRWLDVIAVGLWPSRGLELHGIEVKVSRADFRRELEQPEKADKTSTRCDRFYIAAPAGIVDPLHLDTIAPNWGLLEVRSDAKGARSVKTTKAAERLTPSAPVDRDFLAAVLRRIPSPTEAMRQEITETIRTELEANIDRRVENEVARRMAGVDDLRRRVAEFEEASGIALEGWTQLYGGVTTPKALGEAVRALATGRGDHWSSWMGKIERAAQDLDSRHDQLSAVAKELRELGALVSRLGLESVA